jgi:hypothetical protein
MSATQMPARLILESRALTAAQFHWPRRRPTRAQAVYQPPQRANPPGQPTLHHRLQRVCGHYPPRDIPPHHPSLRDFLAEGL